MSGSSPGFPWKNYMGGAAENFRRPKWILSHDKYLRRRPMAKTFKVPKIKPSNSSRAGFTNTSALGKYMSIYWAPACSLGNCCRRKAGRGLGAAPLPRTHRGPG